METKIAAAAYQIVCSMIDAGFIESEPEGLDWEYQIAKTIEICLK